MALSFMTIVMLLIVLVVMGQQGPTPVMATDAQPTALTTQPPPATVIRVPARAMPTAAPALRPEVLGLSLRPRTVVIVDAIEISRPWLNGVRDALIDGLGRETSDTTVRAVYLSDGRVTQTGSGYQTTGGTFANALRQTQARLQPRGKRGFWNMIEQALDSRPDHVILITSRSKWAESLPILDGKLREAGRPTFSVINMDTNVPELRRFAEQTGGQYETMRSSELNQR